MTYQLIYSSQATKPLSMEDLERILVDARQGNEARNVTGALVYVDGAFLQLLEGEKETVLALLQSISRDSRHGAVNVLHQGEVEQPTFSNWRMAYLSVQPEQVAAWAGLGGTTSLEAILDDIHREPKRASRVMESILRAL